MENNRHSPGTPKKRLEISADYREKPSGLPDLLLDAGYKVDLVKLPYGDYIINREIFIERKTGRDFAISIIDGRLFKQAYRMKNSQRRCLYLVEGNPYDTEIDISRESVKGAILSLQAIWYIPVLYTANQEQSCQTISMISHQMDKLSDVVELRHGYRPKKLITRKLHVIQGLPNVGPLIAKRLLEHFKSVRNIMTATENELALVKGIGKNKALLINKVIN
jgi:DNA excision repair protein ERCC-4